MTNSEEAIKKFNALRLKLMCKVHDGIEPSPAEFQEYKSACAALPPGKCTLEHCNAPLGGFDLDGQTKIPPGIIDKPYSDIPLDEIGHDEQAHTGNKKCIGQTRLPFIDLNFADLMKKIDTPRG